MLTSGKLKEADALLLDLLGITANIGAHKTNAAATTLKESLQDIKTGEYKQAYKDFSLSYDKLIKEIEAYL